MAPPRLIGIGPVRPPDGTVWRDRSALSVSRRGRAWITRGG
ncbi:hypothetical protein ABT124_31105 [Streptomyces sp. NPDC001982]